MPDSYKNLPPDFWDDLETLKDEIARRTRAEKLTMIHCFKGGDAPPPNLAPLLDAINTAAQYPEARDTIYTALESPETINIDPTWKDTSESVSQEEAETLARNVSVMFRLLDKGYKTTIAAAIRDKAKRGTLTIGQRFVWGQLLVALTMTAERKPCDIRDFIADAFSVSLDELDTLTAETLKEKNIKIQVEDEAGGYLPGMEPKEKRMRYPAPTYIYPPFTMIPTAELARNIHNLNFKNTEIGAMAEIGIDKRPHSHFVYMLMLDKLAEQYPITAGDKNILIALGNLYGERLAQPGGKGLQGGSVITAADIIRRFRGLDATDRIDQQTIDAVTERMGYLMKLSVSFDFTQHFAYRKKDIGDGEEVELAIPDEMRRIDSKTGTVIRFSYIGNMVHANTIEVEYASGRIETAWEILTPPIVFDYAQKIKQVATIETRLLDLRKKAKASTNNTTGADVMKVYLIERINAMIDVKTHQPKDAYSQTITLATMFEDLRIEANNREQKRLKVNMARDILDHFKDTPDKHRGRFIKGYKVVKGYRGAVTGFEILF